MPTFLHAFVAKSLFNGSRYRLCDSCARLPASGFNFGERICPKGHSLVCVSFSISIFNLFITKKKKKFFLVESLSRMTIPYGHGMWRCDVCSKEAYVLRRLITNDITGFLMLFQLWTSEAL
jgi:hypothetical protein